MVYTIMLDLKISIFHMKKYCNGVTVWSADKRVSGSYGEDPFLCGSHNFRIRTEGRSCQAG